MATKKVATKKGQGRSLVPTADQHVMDETLRSFAKRPQIIHQLPSLEVLRDYLKINQAARNGRPHQVFTWKQRPRKYFSSDRAWKAWNARYAGESAGHLTDEGYWQITINKVVYLAQRVLYYLDTGVEPGDQVIDHRNGILDDLRRSNLRPASSVQNCQNTKTRESISGVKGVWYDERRGNYATYIYVNKKRVYLGSFLELELAAAARAEAERMYFGKFRRQDLGKTGA